jgi:hypothetical protein
VIPLDVDVMAMYPEDNLLPGMTHAVIEDHDQDVRNVFEEETAGFSDHPADMLGDTQESPEWQETKSSTDGPVVMLEKMGVSDPECDKSVDMHVLHQLCEIYTLNRMSNPILLYIEAMMQFLSTKILIFSLECSQHFSPMASAALRIKRERPPFHLNTRHSTISILPIMLSGIITRTCSWS